MCCGMSCLFENRYSGECRKPRGIPCPQEYDNEDDYKAAVADAEWCREQGAEFARSRRYDEK